MCQDLSKFYKHLRVARQLPVEFSTFFAALSRSTMGSQDEDRIFLKVIPSQIEESSIRAAFAGLTPPQLPLFRLTVGRALQSSAM